MDSARLPADLLHDAAARIRWQQKLLCGLRHDDHLNVDGRDALGLYLAFEDIYQAITEAVRQLEGTV